MIFLWIETLPHQINIMYHQIKIMYTVYFNLVLFSPFYTCKLFLRVDLLNSPNTVMSLFQNDKQKSLKFFLFRWVRKGANISPYTVVCWQFKTIFVISRQNTFYNVRIISKFQNTFHWMSFEGFLSEKNPVKAFHGWARTWNLVCVDKI